MRDRSVVLLVAATIVAGCTIEQRTDRDDAEAVSTRKEIIQPAGMPRLPVFSTAVRSGDLIFLSGQLGALQGIDPPRLVEGGIEAETRQTMDNIVATLAAAGATLDDLIKCTVFLADMADYAAMNTVYAEYFPSDPPARSAVAGSGLALGALVEIECIAATPRSR